MIDEAFSIANFNQKLIFYHDWLSQVSSGTHSIKYGKETKC